MRKLAALIVVLVVLAVVGEIADVVARHYVERRIAADIEANVAGTTARVQISSWPFLGRLAASGTVNSLHAQITGARVGDLPVDTVSLAVQGLKVSRSDLVAGRVVLRSIRGATATAALSQTSIDSATGLAITLGAGTVGLDGATVPAHLAIAGGQLRITAPPLPAITLPVLPPSLLPCTAAGMITPGRLTLSCSTATIPPALVAAVAGR